MIKLIKEIHSAVRDDIGSLITFRAMPSKSLTMIDPFLFLNHHGRQIYQPENLGLPFAPHPHRGFETVTFILEGDIAHKDSGGNESIINAGGVQWMSAGSGLVHEEVSSEDFKANGGALEILQLWVNLPARLKMTTPRYVGLQGNKIPTFKTKDSQTQIKLVSGRWETCEGPFHPLIDVTTMLIKISEGHKLDLNVSKGRNIFFYVIHGQVQVNETLIQERHTVEFQDEGNQLKLLAIQNTQILFCHAPPLNESVVSHGPFVMNTKEEIYQAISDYQDGKFE